MEYTVEQQAHGINVIYKGWGYPLKSGIMALRFLNNLKRFEEHNLLSNFLRYEVVDHPKGFKATSWHIHNTKAIPANVIEADRKDSFEETLIRQTAYSGVVVLTRGRAYQFLNLLEAMSFRSLLDRIKREQKMGAFIYTDPKEFAPNDGKPVGKGLALLNSKALETVKKEFSCADNPVYFAGGWGKTRLPVLDTMLFLHRAPLSNPFGLNIDGAVTGRMSSAPRTATGANLLAYVAKPRETVSQITDRVAKNVSTLTTPGDLPAKPVDQEDMSTEACWKRQLHTIKDMIAKAQQNAETLRETKMALSDSQRNVYEADKKIVAQGITIKRQAESIRNQSSYIDTLREERNAYKAQVLKNAESIAVVKYSQREHEWHLVKDGIAYTLWLVRDAFSELMATANSINLGRASLNSFNLVRKPYYYKEDYA